MDVNGRIDCNEIDPLCIHGAYMVIASGKAKGIIIEFMTHHLAGEGPAIGTVWIDTDAFETTGGRTTSDSMLTYRQNAHHMYPTY